MTSLIQRGLEIVPGYTLVRRLGSGMAGEVWVARASGGVYVAVKVVRDMSMIGSKRELGALRIVREVKHTNLCPLIGVWFFDADGELLSNSATDDILGRESSLIDTECLSGDRNSDEMRETHAMGLADSNVDLNPHDPSAPSDSHLQETGEYTGDAADDSGFLSALSRKSTPRPNRGSDLTRPRSDSSTLPTPGDRRNEDDPDSSLGDAKQMVIAMGLGEKTLHDRLVEMRAPGNAPENENDPLHLPGGVPAPELIRYITGAASAIDELNIHHNIYHCDIKPQNILIVGGNAQVCDFGLARRVHENRRTQLAIGTPAYGAPEMLFDQTYTKTIDQYSLAITYYEMRTGNLPFETSRRSSFLRAKANGELRLDELPVREREVIERATRLDPSERYETCSQFAEKLKEAIFSTGVSGASGRRTKALIATAICLLTLIGGGVAYYVSTLPKTVVAENDAKSDESIQSSSTDPLENNREAEQSSAFDSDIRPDDALAIDSVPQDPADLSPNALEPPNTTEPDSTPPLSMGQESPAVAPEKHTDVAPAIPDPTSGEMPVVSTGPDPIEMDPSTDAPPIITTLPANVDPPTEPKRTPETIDEYLAAAVDQLDRWSTQNPAIIKRTDLEAFADQIESFAPTLDADGNWVDPQIASITKSPFEERHVPSVIAIADRLRDETLADETLADKANKVNRISTEDANVLAGRAALASLRSLVRSLLAPSSSVSPDAKDDVRNTLRGEQAERIAAFRDLFGDDDRFPSAEHQADASYTLAKFIIDAKKPLSFDDDEIETAKERRSDLNRANALNSNPVRLSRLAEAQMGDLVALRVARDDAGGGDDSSAQRNEVIDAVAVDITRDLDKPAAHADQKTGWDRVSGELNLNAHAAAGLAMWDANRVSDAMKHWIAIQNDALLDLHVRDDWRTDVANRCLDWLAENTDADDNDIETVRFSKSTRRGTGVLELVSRFAGKSADLRKKIQPEQFLLAAAKGDYRTAMEAWDAMNLSMDDPRTTPQIGYALWELCSRRLKDNISDTERAAITNDLVFATVAQLDNATAGERLGSDIRLSETLANRINQTLDSVHKMTTHPIDAMPQISQRLDRPELFVLCKRYLDTIANSTAPSDHGRFLDRLEKVQFAAATAAMIEKDVPARDEFLLIASEAFIQTRYEEIDDLPAVEMIERLFAYEKAGDNASRSAPTIYRQFLVARVADQRGYLSRDDEDVLKYYGQARGAYTQLIENPNVPPDLRGSVYRCRASLLSRLAVQETLPRKRELLELAAKDASAAVSLPPRWHFDNDDRLTTAAEVNISTVRLVTDLELSEKQKLLDDADRYIAEAIAVRKQLGYPTFMHETHRLNGYLFDLLMSPKGRRHSNREQKAMTLMSQLGTVPIPSAQEFEVEKTLAAPSYRTKVHWHCMCAMVHRLAEHPEMAMSHIRYALQIAEEHLPETDDRRHRAVLIYVQFKGPELLEGVSKNGRADQQLVRELSDKLNTIVDPNSYFRIEKQGYVRDLEKMAKP